MTRAVVIGAGVTGLAAAYRLLQLKPDWEVIVLEQDDHSGGLASSWRNEEFKTDLGPHRVYTELPEIEKLLPELIEHDQMMTVSRRSELLLQGHMYHYPVKASELLREMGPLKMTRLGISALLGKIGAIKKAPANYEEAMVASFGKGVYSMIVGPYTEKVWKLPPEQLSEEVARVRVSAGNVNRLVKQLFNRKEKKGQQSALGSFGYIRGGVIGLVKSLEKRVHDAGGVLQLGKKVEGFRINDGRVTGVYLTRAESNAAEAELLECGCVLSTVPITNLVTQLQEQVADPPSASAASGLVFVGLILVALVMKKPYFTPNSWIYFPESDLIFNRSYEPKNWDPSMSPGDKTMSVFEVTARWESKTWRAPDEEIIAQVKADIVKTGLVRADEIEKAFLVRVPYTYPLYTTDYRERLSTIFCYLEKFPNLITTGRQGLFNHNNMDHCMLMGIRAAETMSREKLPATTWYRNLDQFAHFRIVD